MPNGRCHSAATIATTSAFLSYWAAGVVVSSTAITSNNEWAVWAAVGAFIGLVVEPDLDQDEQAAPMRTMRETGGEVLAGIWQLYWTPYAKAIPHRSWLSHGPGIGTLGRVVYLAPLYSLPLYGWSHFFGFPLAHLLAILVGLCWVDLLHYIMDFWVPRRFFPQTSYRR